MSGKQIKLFLVDGTPGEATTAEIASSETFGDWESRGVE